jgi:hypothetical protein
MNTAEATSAVAEIDAFFIPNSAPFIVAASYMSFIGAATATQAAGAAVVTMVLMRLCEHTRPSIGYRGDREGTMAESENQQVKRPG